MDTTELIGGQRERAIYDGYAEGAERQCFSLLETRCCCVLQRGKATQQYTTTINELKCRRPPGNMIDLRRVVSLLLSYVQLGLSQENE